MVEKPQLGSVNAEIIKSLQNGSEIIINNSDIDQIVLEKPNPWSWSTKGESFHVILKSGQKYSFMIIESASTYDEIKEFFGVV